MPLILSLLLLTAQSAVVAVSMLRGLWRSTPAWTIYAAIATLHLMIGLVLTPKVGSDYPIALVYLEPVILIGQIAFTFESSLKYMGVPLRGGSPEGRLLLWLIPLVPTALLLPVEIGFVQDAAATWHTQQRDALALLYALRKFLSLTLLVIFAAIPLVAKALNRMPSMAIRFHHFVLTAYLCCGVVGFFGKQTLSDRIDFYFTIVFFVVGPAICFALWAGRMWKTKPEALEVRESSALPGGMDGFERRHALRYP